MSKSPIFFLFLMMVVSCQNVFGQIDLPGATFSIYLLPDGVEPGQLAKLGVKNLKPVGEPVISSRNFLSYLKDRHEIRFDYTGADRLKKLKVPVGGRSFVAFVGGEPVYAGAFWQSFSSRSFDGFTINVTGLRGDFPVVRIAEKYPDGDSGDERQDDARSDPRVMRALAESGVLFEELQLRGRCKKIVPTGTRDMSYFVTFGVGRVHKGEFSGPEIEFVVRGSLGTRFLNAVRPDLKPGGDEGGGYDFDADTEFLLTFERQIGKEKPALVFKDFAAPARAGRPGGRSIRRSRNPPK